MLQRVVELFLASLFVAQSLVQQSSYESLHNGDRSFAVANIPSDEWTALNDLYDSTQGSDWTWHNQVEWNFTDPTANPCTEFWAGLNCSFTPPYENYYVTGIYLPEANLAGSLPSSIGTFQYLEHLRLDGNNITGTLPAAVGNLTHLIYLRLQGNSLRGTIPAALGRLAALQELSLERNRLTGPLPPELGNLSSIASMHVGTNRLTGTLPASLGKLTTLRHGIFYYNNFTGTVPGTFGDLTDLVTLNLYNNSFTGTIPVAFCDMSKMSILTLGYNFFSQTIPSCLADLPRLIYLDLFSNALTGPIPVSFARMRRLIVLYLNRNQITGNIETLCSVPSLGQIYVEDNRFTGTLPECLSSLTNLTSLYLASNQHMYGTIPDSWGSLGRLRYLDLSKNAISGTMPQSFAQLSDLTFLYLFNNKLTGTVPQSYSQLRNLTLMLLQNNQLSGPVDKLFNTTVQRRLNTIQLSGNAFTGELPGEALFADSPLLAGFFAVDNCFHGSIPASLCDCASLRMIALDGASSSKRCNVDVLPGVGAWQRTVNRFGGEIPLCLFQMPFLATLHLSGLRLTGSLPSNLTLGPQLSELSLTHNSLSGRIPSSIQRRVWRSLDLSYNRFLGELEDNFNTVTVEMAVDEEIPRVGQIVEDDYLSANTYLALENNRLSGRIPDALTGLLNLTILTGNLFACNWRGTDLPPNDDGRSGYECGSAAVNSQLYAYVIVAGTVMVAVLILYRYRAICHQYLDVQSVVDNVFKWLLAVHQPALLVRVPNFKRVCDTADVIGRVAVGSAVLIVAILIPMYAILTHFYGTVTYQYAWSISAAFLSGVTPFVLEFVAYLVILIAPLCLMQLTEYRYIRQLANLPRLTDASVSTAAPEELHPVGVVKPAQVAAAYFKFFAANLVIVTGVNIGFVVIALSKDKAGLAAAQILLSIFKGFWNSVGAGRLMNWSFRKVLEADPSKAATLKTHLAASLFNNIGIPCLVVAAISPDCFYHVFHPSHSTGFQYIYLTCAVFLHDQCQIFIPTVASTSYTPPFTYSYECGAQYIMYYAATFVYLALEVAFVIPVALFLLTRAYKRAIPGTWWYLALQSVLSSALVPLGSAEDFDADGVLKTSIYTPIFDARQLVVLLLTYLSILLSFGVVFPPIAVVMAVTVVSLVVSNRLIMGRYLTSALELQAADERAALDRTSGSAEDQAPMESEKAPGVVRRNRGEQYIRAVEMDSRRVGALDADELRTCVGMVLMCCCLFYAIFFYDTLGNAYGMHASVWVFAAWPLVPVVLHFRVRWMQSEWRERLRTSVFGPRESCHGTLEDSTATVSAAEQAESGAVEMHGRQATVNPLAHASHM